MIAKSIPCASLRKQNIYIDLVWSIALTTWCMFWFLLFWRFCLVSLWSLTFFGISSGLGCRTRYCIWERVASPDWVTLECHQRLLSRLVSMPRRRFSNFCPFYLFAIFFLVLFCTRSCAIDRLGVGIRTFTTHVHNHIVMLTGCETGRSAATQNRAKTPPTKIDGELLPPLYSEATYEEVAHPRVPTPQGVFKSASY